MHLKTSFGLIIQDIDVYEYDLNLLINFDEIVKINNKFIIKIPEFLNFDIKLIGFGSHPIVIAYIKNISELIINKYILVEYCFLATELRKEIASNQHELCPQKIELLKYIINTNNDNVKNLNLRFYNYCTKGYFIETDVNKITNIKLTLNNNHVRY